MTRSERTRGLARAIRFGGGVGERDRVGGKLCRRLRRPAGRPVQVVAGICALALRAQRISTRRPHCSKVTPLDYKGHLTFWYQGVFEGDPDLLRQYYKDFFETFRKTYPNIQLEEQALTYNDLLDKFRTALLGNAGPMAVRLQILGGTEFASKGYLQPLKPEDVG